MTRRQSLSLASCSHLSGGVTTNFALAWNSAHQAEEPEDQKNNENRAEHAAEARSTIGIKGVISTAAAKQ